MNSVGLYHKSKQNIYEGLITTKKAREIEPVKSREEKRNTYQKHLQQYKKAINDGFYFEAILIDYACLEDRLRYMLYYLGVLQREEDYRIVDSNSTRIKDFRSILHEYVNPKSNMKIGTISGKRDIIQSVFRFALDPHKATDTFGIVEKVFCKKLIDPEKASQILDCIEDIEEWCKYRNEIIHSLMNKNLDSLNTRIKEKAEEGFLLFRQLDNHVNWVKRKNIRKAMKLEGQ